VIDRRTLIATLAGGLLAAPFATLAQLPAKLPRIGILGNESKGTAWDGFRQGMRELGYVDGRNVTMDWRWAEGRTDLYPALAIELVQLKADVIVASSTQAIRAVKQATGTIPVVMANSAYPDKIGLVESLARPGGNVTGLSNVSPDLMGKRFELLKEIAPKVSRVAVLWNPASPVEPLGFRAVQAAGAANGLEILSIEVRTPDDYAAAFAAVTASRADALYALANPVNSKFRQLIADFALKSRLPDIYEDRSYVESGGLFSYGPSFTDMYRRAATYVDKILKGQKPAELPVAQPTEFELFINPKTAKALGLTIPQSMLLRGGVLIE
jgi:putative ABC transport system substrate-binding protein